MGRAFYLRRPVRHFTLLALAAGLAACGTSPSPPGKDGRTAPYGLAPAECDTSGFGLIGTLRPYGPARGDAVIGVVPGGATQVAKSGVALTRGDALRMHLDEDRGLVAWVETVLRNDATRVVVNCFPIDAAERLRTLTTLSNGLLYWIESRHDRDGSELIEYDVGQQREARRFYLDGVVSWMDRRGGALQLIVFLPTVARWQLLAIDPAPGSLSLVVDSDHSIWIGADGEIYRATGPAGLATVFWATSWLFGPQSSEPFAFGNDHLGRISNTAAERLLALTHLLALQPSSPTLRRRAQLVARALTDGLDEQGRLCSIKYSADRRTCIAYAHDVMGIHDALLAAHPYLELDLQARALDLAQKAFASYLPDYDGRDWRFPKCIAETFDGLPMPFNQQHRLARVALRLADLTGEDRYRVLAQAAAERFMSEWTVDAAGVAWYYWPSSFYAGWTARDAVSCNTPERAPERPSAYEDSYHASITVDFLLAAGAASDLPEQVIRGLQVAPRKWELFMRASGAYSRPLWRHLPVGALAGAASVAPEYARKIDLPFADFDNQMAFIGHAVASRRLRDSDSAGLLKIERYEAGAKRWVKVEELGRDTDWAAWWSVHLPATR